MYVIYTHAGEYNTTEERGGVRFSFGEAVRWAGICLAGIIGERDPRRVSAKAWVVYVPEGESEDYDGPVCFEAHAEGWIR